MELSDVIVFMRQEAIRLDRWVMLNPNLSRRQTPTVLGTSELNYERVFGWLERNNPQMLVPSKKHYDELVSCAEEVDKLVADGSFEDGKTPFERLKYFANRLANTLQDTAEDLMSDEQIINLISNIRIEDIDTLSGLLHKLQELPKSRPMPQNDKLWSQADKKVRKKVYEAGTTTNLNGKREEDFWEMIELRELHSSLTHEYSNIESKMEGKSLDEMAEMMVKEGKAESPLEAMGQLALEAEQNALIERRLWRIIEKEYRKIDTDYDQALSIREKEVADIIEQIEKSLCSNESLVKLDRMLEEKLLTNFQQMQSYNFFDILLQSQAQNLVKGSIDALEAIKSNIGHPQQAPDKPQKPTDKLVEKPAGTDQGCLQEIIESLKNWQKLEKTDKDLEATKQVLSPLDVTYEILSKAENQSRRTRKALQWLDMVADGEEGFCRALLNELSSPEVIADLESWLRKPAGTGQKIKKTKKPKKTEKRFQPWTKSGDACFIIEDNKIKFHYKDEIKNLRLKNDSRTHKLMFLFAGQNPLPRVEIQNICTKGTRPSDIVKYANGKLNDKIAATGFLDVPNNVEFMKYDEKQCSYGLWPRIKHKEDFNNSENCY